MSSTSFVNRIPLDDVMTVLDLLTRRWGDNTAREIRLWDKKTGPYVEIEHYHDFSDSAWHRFLVTQRVVDALLAARLVCGKPEWGYTDMMRLRISPTGEAAFWRRWKELDTPGHPMFSAEEWITSFRSPPRGGD